MLSNLIQDESDLHFKNAINLEHKSLDISKIYPTKDPIVYYDLTRLISRSQKPFATGIDRVDFEYLKQHLNDNRIKLRCIALVDDQIKVLDASIVQKYINDLDHVWSGLPLVNCPSSCLKENNYLNAIWFKRFRLKNLGLLSFNSLDFAKDQELQSFYFNASHVGILSLKSKVCEKFFRSFKGKVVAYIHDLIPLTHKKFSTKAASKKLKHYLQNAINYNHTILFNSKTTKQTFFNFYNLDSNHFRSIVQYPIIEKTLKGLVRKSVEDLVKESCFVSIGTIEPRKNHIFLLKIWKKMILNTDKHIPKLVIVGKRGWKNRNTFKLLDRLKAISDRIVEINDANDVEVDFLAKRSKAVLFPSLIEGFHISVHELLLNNIMFVGSNIETHREILEYHTNEKNTYLLPLHEKLWHELILNYK